MYVLEAPKDVETDVSVFSPELADDLTQRYREIERAQELWELILPYTDTPVREWVQMPATLGGDSKRQS